MPNRLSPHIAILDYGMGNLFSVLNACEKFGMEGKITSSREDVQNADAVILPGVGAFGDAMETLEKRGLTGLLKEVATSGKLLVGICLGMQILMTESFEFGHHLGLGLIRGKVVRFEKPVGPAGHILKVPEVQWNQIRIRAHNGGDPWSETMLAGVKEGEYMYFVHSYYCIPEDPDLVLSLSRYGNIDYCSTIGKGNVFACQYHPERSGPAGLKIYENLASVLKKKRQ